MEPLKLPINYNTADWKTRKQAREQYIKEQQGICICCMKPLTSLPAIHIRDKPINWSLFPPNFMQYPIHLHHNHKTGMTLGAVHAQCNAYLWQYKGE